ncbi:MAG: phenylacetate--CoA ligase family protein [Prolixibacteraceae bacterium]|nr:phenylacetate--CoA ligase family protein [Burkholderiales bacterium]
MFSSFTYRYSPIRTQELLISAKSSLRNLMREGRSYEALAAQLHESQWWTGPQLRDFQSRSLRKILDATARDVPYYREKFRPLDLDFEDAAFPEAIAKLPLMTKEDVREAGKTMISEKKRGPLFAGSTSGTTGAPLRLVQDLPAINRENAFVWRQLTWAGLRRGDRRAWMRGDMIVPATHLKPPFWRLNRAENMLMLSSYHLSESAAADYVEALAVFDPVVIQAYPSSIGFLAGWMRSAGVRYRGKSLRGIVTSSESLSDERRREIEDAFGCKVFDWYGQFERVAAIGTCEHGRYHLLSDYSFVEMLPAGDGLYELVGTGFNNLSMPLIRYRCGDLVRPAPATQLCSCGRSFPLIEQVIGRVDDAVKLTDGRSIGRLDHIFKDVEGILEAQIRQDRLDAITILVVPIAGFSDRTRDRLQSNVRHRLGDATNVEIRLVDAIPRTGNGKFKGVVCNV